MRGLAAPGTGASSHQPACLHLTRLTEQSLRVASRQSGSPAACCRGTALPAALALGLCSSGHLPAGAGGQLLRQPAAGAAAGASPPPVSPPPPTCMPASPLAVTGSLSQLLRRLPAQTDTQGACTQCSDTAPANQHALLSCPVWYRAHTTGSRQQLPSLPYLACPNLCMTLPITWASNWHQASPDCKPFAGRAQFPAQGPAHAAAAPAAAPVPASRLR